MQTFNQFQKELRDRGIDLQEAYMMTMMYEQIVELSNQMTICAKLIEALTDSVSGFVQLNETQQREYKRFMRGGRPDGVEVHSVAIDPNEDN